MKKYSILVTLILLIGFVYAGDLSFQTSIGLSPKAKEISQRAEWVFAPDHAVGIEAAYDLGNDFYTHVQIERQGGIGDWFMGGYYLGSSSKSREGRVGFYFPFGNMRWIAGMTLVDQQVYPIVGIDYSLREWHAKLQFSSQIELGLSYTWGAADKALTDIFHVIAPSDGMKTNLNDIMIRGYYLDNGTIYLNGKALSLRADGLFSERVSLPSWGPKKVNIQIKGDTIRDYQTSLTIIRTAPYWDVPESRQSKWIPLLDKVGKEPRNLLLPTENVSRSELFTYIGRLMDLDKKQYEFQKQFTDVPDSTLRNVLTTMVGRDILRGNYPQFKPSVLITRKDAYIIMSRFLSTTPGMTVLDLPDIPQHHWLAADLSKLVYYKVVTPSVGWLDGSLSRGGMMDLLSLWYPFALIPTQDSSITQTKEKVVPIVSPKTVIRKVVVKEEKPVPAPSTNRIELPINEQTAGVLGSIAVIRKVLSVEKAPPMREDASASNITLLTPLAPSIVRAPSFTVTGKGSVGQWVRVGSHMVKIPSSGQFSVALSLNPGVNNIGVMVPSGSKQVIVVVYQKQFQDLPPKDMFTPFYEKIGTLGYFPTDKRFEPSKVLSKKDFYQSLIKAGYGSINDLETLGPLDQHMSYKQAVDVMQKITGRSLSKDVSSAGDLTRRMFSLLLYELPNVKSAMQKKFPDTNI